VIRSARRIFPILGAFALAFSTFASVTDAAGPNLPPVGQARAVCPAPELPGFARCFAQVRTDVISAAASPAGYHPSDLISAYKLPSATRGTGQTVAIVDAFDDPNAEADLAVYRSTFGLAPCTTANGCFSKVDQNGGTSYPRSDSGWSDEISLDLDMVSAICPNCHILLVEANNNSLTNLALAVDRAATMGANAISNSYGGGESSTETTRSDPHYKHPGIAVTASTGDAGFGPQYPAASRFVTAVGGTHLVADSSARGWSETAWSGAGSGCSAFEAKPSWQHDTGCTRRTIGDVSAVADPNTGVSVYDTFNEPGFLVFGGTSVSSPIIASVYALAGNEAAVVFGSRSYSHTAALFDVTSGSNGSCGGSYLCTAGPGYDGPTGNGTPNGVSAF
jgi:subtilase family serine protease